MIDNYFFSLIGQPLNLVRTGLEEKGYQVVIKEFSKPKMKTDTQLVIKADKLNDNTVELIVGDFLIDL